VQPKDIGAFYTRYAEVCKLGMVALKKRDRKAKKQKKKKGGKGEGEKEDTKK
jgi:signal recognition particle subunit SRP14